MECKCKHGGFKCGYCGEEYKSPLDRATCEIRCHEIAKKKRQEEFEKVRMLRETRQRRYDKMVDEMDKFNADYNCNYRLVKTVYIKSDEVSKAVLKQLSEMSTSDIVFNR